MKDIRHFWWLPRSWDKLWSENRKKDEFNNYFKAFLAVYAIITIAAGFNAPHLILPLLVTALVVSVFAMLWRWRETVNLDEE